METPGWGRAACLPRGAGAVPVGGPGPADPPVSFPQMCTPANTPATPPNFPDALTMFSRLKASESFNSSSPVASMATSPPPPAPPLPQHGAFNPAWPAASPPGQQQSMWTPAPPVQPAGWPAAVSQQATAEQKANVTMEAER